MLNVPLLAQEKSMCCWHTSAHMIWRYWQAKTGRQGPMNTIMPVYEANSGLEASPQAFIVLARKTGMKAVASRNHYTSDDLSSFLRERGPIWCAGYWYGFGHVIVLTGVDGGEIFINDPDGAQKKSGTLAWFNEKLANGLAGALMYKDPAAY